METPSHSHSVHSAKAEVTHLASGTCLINLYGELDNLAFQEISVFISNQLSRRDRAVVVDFSELHFADSSALKLLSALAQHFGVDKCAVYGVNPNIRRLLELGALADKVAVLSENAELDQWWGAGQAG